MIGNCLANPLALKSLLLWRADSLPNHWLTESERRLVLLPADCHTLRTALPDY